ncbi:MAG: hypothetical protein MZU95_10570 [Desulfomicrobium escambiense]|nr:hypothetical protein [Desulfomicrobium escambiense]
MEIASDMNAPPMPNTAANDQQGIEVQSPALPFKQAVDPKQPQADAQDEQ